MKTKTKLTIVAAIAASLVAGTFFASAADEKKDEAKKAYPLTTCLVSSEKLGEMGKPFVTTHEGREVQLCCKGCLKDFNKSPAKYLKKLDEAEAAAKAKK